MHDVTTMRMPYMSYWQAGHISSHGSAENLWCYGSLTLEICSLVRASVLACGIKIVPRHENVQPYSARQITPTAVPSFHTMKSHMQRCMGLAMPASKRLMQKPPKNHYEQCTKCATVLSLQPAGVRERSSREGFACPRILPWPSTPRKLASGDDPRAGFRPRCPHGVSM